MKNTLKGKWVFDTNLLIYVLDDNSLFHKVAKSLFQLLLYAPVDTYESNTKLIGFVAQQNILEAQHVLVKQYKRNLKEANKIINDIVTSFQFHVITPMPTTYLHYNLLIKDSNKRALDMYDLYLAATMLDNGITHIITANEKDFVGIKRLSVYNPWRKD